MLWLIGIGGVWALSCVMAVALCVMARRGDEQLSRIFAGLPEMAPDVEVDFVATLSEPEPARPASAPVTRTSV
jgi:hypothetical protein